VEIAYGANGRFAPTCLRFRKAVESGELMVEDYTNYQMCLRFKAGAMGVPYLPVKSGMGTDIVNQWGFDADLRRRDPRLPDQKLLVQNDPFSKGAKAPLVLVPAINPDVSILHVQQADTRGTVRITGLTFADVEQAFASKHVIVTCEELLAPEVLQAEPDRNQIPFFVVDAVVHLPFGAHPAACFGYYDYDSQHLKLYNRMAADEKKFSTYLEKYIFSVTSHQDYLEKIGQKALDCIKAVPPYGYALGVKRK
jgi:glutaconate CoA-transferase subunit A